MGKPDTRFIYKALIDPAAVPGFLLELEALVKAVGKVPGHPTERLEKSDLSREEATRHLHDLALRLRTLTTGCHYVKFQGTERFRNYPKFFRPLIQFLSDDPDWTSNPLDGELQCSTPWFLDSLFNADGLNFLYDLFQRHMPLVTDDRNCPQPMPQHVNALLAVNVFVLSDGTIQQPVFPVFTVDACANMIRGAILQRYESDVADDYPGVPMR